MPIRPLALRMRLLGSLLPLVLLTPCAVHASELSRARGLLRSRDAEERRRAVQMLVALDSAKAIRPLEEAIRRSHKAMEKLAKEIDRVDVEYAEAAGWVSRARRRGDAEMLSIAIRYKNRIYDQWKAAADQMKANLFTGRDVGIAFSRFRSHGAIRLVEEGAQNERDPFTRQLYIQALGAAGRPRSIPILLELFEHKDPRVRAAAVRAIRPFLLDTRVLDRLPALTTDEVWAVRLGAYETMARAPFDLAVPFLVAAAVKETGQMAVSVDALLLSLTGRSFAQTPKAWEGWWAKHRDAVLEGLYERPSKDDVAKEPTRSTFFRIPVPSLNVLFAIDVSGSMLEDFRLKDARSNEVRQQLELDKTRLGFARAEAVRAIRALPDGARFNVVLYGGDAVKLARRPLKASRSTRRRAERWIVKQKTRGLTNIWDALRESFGDHLVQGGGRQRFSDLPDTIVFLTDGTPTRGRFQRRETLRELVRRWNASAGTVIHTVGIGEDHSKELLKELAQDNFGFYVDLSKGQGGLSQWRRGVPIAERRPHFGRQLEEAILSIETGERAERVAALKTLASMGAHAAPAASAVAKLLDDVFEDVGRAAGNALVAMGEVSVPYVIKHLGASDAVTVAHAIQTLERLGMAAAGALDRLLDIAKDTASEHRVSALRAIAAMGPAAAEAEADLATLCEDADGAVVEAAEKALSEIKDG